MASPAIDDFQLEMLPQHGWDDGLELKAEDGTLLQREGTIKEALKVLNYKDPETVRMLIRCGDISGRKLNPSKKNSPYRVDLLECWAWRQKGYKESQL